MYIGAHAPNTINNFNIILPLQHYYETTGHLLTFKVFGKLSNRAIDNTRSALSSLRCSIYFK
jgi:hypothetical protein